MKKSILILALLSFYLWQALAAKLPVGKLVSIRLAQKKELCLEKTDSLKLVLNSYAELPTQEWYILPSGETDFYYLKTADDYHLILDADSTQIVNSCRLTIAQPDHDDYKFSVVAQGDNLWSFVPKLNPDLSLQSYKGGVEIYAIPQQEFGTSTFIIDSVPVRRLKPSLTAFPVLACSAGLLANEKNVSVYGADATAYKAGMYPAQYIVRIYLSPNRKDRLDVVVFDDVKQISRERTYLVKPNAKAHAVITLVKNDKQIARLEEAVCRIMDINWVNNSIEFRLEGAQGFSDSNKNPLPIFDFIYKGLIRLQ